MKIGIIGAGQMGANYANNLTALGVRADDIVAYDVQGAKAAALAERCGIVHSADFPGNLDAAIVVVSTPAHADVITRLSHLGVRHILCEKPLGFDRKDVGTIAACAKVSQVHTALVINFSDALPFLLGFMADHDVRPLELSGLWGKPRPLDKIPRPSAGDVEDEAVHPIAFALALLLDKVGRIGVTARVGSLPFVDQVVQARAYELDHSFPSRPNHSTSALMTVESAGEVVPIDIRSSFLMPRQTRCVSGVLGNGIKPHFLFEVLFDEKKGSGVQDLVRIVDLGAKETILAELDGSKKLADLTQAFLKTIGSGDSSIDPRLADIPTASRLVDIHTAILRSNSRGCTVIV